MTASNHPEYSAETEHLQRTLEAVDQQAQALDYRSRHTSGADNRTTYILRDMIRQQAQPLNYMRLSPYFGRIDVNDHDSTAIETYYIGEYHLDHDGVTIVSWQAPIAALFYKSVFGAGSYQSPGGKVDSQLFLKRRLLIDNRKLTAIRDELDRRSQTRILTSPNKPDTLDTTSASQPVADPDEFLRSVLAGQASTKLKQIVTSIQAEQYALIEASPRQALIVQGVAGSGKTSVALHRLSYLLYPGNAQDIRATNCIVFGPNRLFLNYTSAILPRLGVESIVQTTPSAWAIEHIEAGIQEWQKEQDAYRSTQHQPRSLELTDRTLDTLLSTDAARDYKRILYLRSRLKSSRRMDELLERYVEYLRNQIKFPVEGWMFENVDVGVFSVQVILPHAQLVESFQRFANRPLVDHRARFIEQCLTLIEDAFYGAIQRQGYNIDEISEGPRRTALNNVKNRLRRRVFNTWPPFNVITAYANLLSNPELISKLGSDLFTESDLDLLVATATEEQLSPNIVDYSDLSALHFLQLIAAPPDGERYQGAQRYDHIVIDEAQDVSELEYLVIQRFFARHNSCTILGDLPQSIYSHRGISSWSQVKEIFSGNNHTYSELHRSYRTTYEIAELADSVVEILGRKRSGLPRVEPFDRHGTPVYLQNVLSDRDLIQRIKTALTVAQNAGHKNIAIIPKSLDRCRWLMQTLLQQQLQPPIAFADSVNFDYQGGIVVLPLHLAKGVEFDVAIVIDADHQTYSDTEFDGRLLYVAITRAMHELYIFWQGKRSMYLEKTEGLPLP